jgi:probable HAF family extracellular repeat protein
MKAKANLSRTSVVAAVVFLAVAVALFGVGPRTAETQTTTSTYYKVVDLGTLGGSSSWPSAINDKGQVVGSSNLAGDQNNHAFLYKDGKMTDLGTLGGTSSEAKGINESGQVVGWSDNSSGQRRGFLYDSTNGMRDLNDLIPADSGWTMYEAAGINTDGQIVASSWGNTQPDTDIVCDYWSGSGPAVGAALVLSPTTTGDYEVHDLGYLGGYYSRATSINNSSKVVGFSYTVPCGGGQPFFYDESADPQLQGLSMSEAVGLNNTGKVVGYRKEWINGSCVDVGSGNDCWRAVLYDSATKQIQYLGDLRGTYPSGPRGVFGSVASGINDSGDVVGRSGIQDGTYGGDVHAFLKESGQPMIDLNTLIPADSGWTITSASAINNNGQIAANGYQDGGGQHALLLTPTSSDIPPPDDTEAPSPPTIASPQNNSYDTDGSFSVSGSAEAGNTVELFEGTTSKGTTKADSSSGAWSIALSGVSEGSHTYTAKATDAAGLTSSASNSVSVKVDKTSPKVVDGSVIPKEDATGVDRTTNVTATFSEAMMASSINGTTFKLFKEGSTTKIGASVVYPDPNSPPFTAKLDPSNSLRSGVTYKAVVSVGAKDLAGNSLDQNASLSGSQQKVWFFKTRN